MFAFSRLGGFFPFTVALDGADFDRRERLELMPITTVLQLQHCRQTVDTLFDIRRKAREPAQDLPRSTGVDFGAMRAAHS